MCPAVPQQASATWGNDEPPMCLASSSVLLSCHVPVPGFGCFLLFFFPWGFKPSKPNGIKPVLFLLNRWASVFYLLNNYTGVGAFPSLILPSFRSPSVSHFLAPQTAESLGWGERCQQWGFNPGTTLELGRIETPEVHVVWALGPLCWFFLAGAGAGQHPSPVPFHLQRFGEEEKEETRTACTA